MRKIGAIVLSVWCGLNSLVAAMVTVLTVMGRSPPALQLVVPDAEIANIDRRALSVISAQAALANPLIIAVCALVMVLIWKGTRQGVTWALPTVAGALVPVQFFGFVSDRFLGNHNVVANVISTVVLLAGLALCALRSNPHPDPLPKGEGGTSLTS